MSRLLLLSSMLLAATSSVASAAVGPDQVYAGASIGGAAALDYTQVSQVKLNQVIGVRLSEEASGLYLQAELSQSLGSRRFGFQVGPRAGFGLALVDARDIEVVASPNLGLGLALGNGAGALNLQPALDLHIWLRDEWCVLVRPIGLDVFMGRTAGARADLLAGLAKRF